MECSESFREASARPGLISCHTGTQESASKSAVQLHHNNWRHARQVIFWELTRSISQADYMPQVRAQECAWKG
jgi:hypothetical protein